ncbi:hypothetical protein CEXT_68051 [Caerostris extrusa]|uniref:Uncharacterized protein n=1 Tax=Caerostris extrusa TaxID=172846 RepID=A0AAV4TAQ6_CAEEX|nr:hypothetical protein CEXT_68051 [Caerostris extrusa]
MTSIPGLVPLSSLQFSNLLQFRKRDIPPFFNYFTLPPAGYFESSHLTNTGAVTRRSSDCKISIEGIHLQGRHCPRHTPWYLNYLITRAGIVAPRLPVSTRNEGAHLFDRSSAPFVAANLCAPALKDGGMRKDH